MDDLLDGIAGSSGVGPALLDVLVPWGYPDTLARGLLGAVLSLVIPGAGQIALGRPLRGGGFLLLEGLAVAAALASTLLAVGWGAAAVPLVHCYAAADGFTLG